MVYYNECGFCCVHCMCSFLGWGLGKLIVSSMSWATASIFAKFIEDLIVLVAKFVIFIHPFVQAVALIPEMLIFANQIRQVLESASDFNRTHLGVACCFLHTHNLTYSPNLSTLFLSYFNDCL